MDSYLLNRLESIMAKSPISPYMWARILIVGSFLLWVWENGKSLIAFNNIAVFAAVVLLYAAVHILVLDTATVAERSARVFGNDFRTRREGLRLISWILFSMSAALIVLHPAFFSASTITLAIWMMYLYFTSIDWSRPIPQRVHKKRNISRTRKRAF